jgi:hypothetical protein
MRNVSDAWQIEVQTVEPVVPGPSRVETEIAMARLKKYKSPDNVQIAVGLI